jgi:hypothetical protein
MRIQTYSRQVPEPDSAGGVIRRGAGVQQEGAAQALDVLSKATLELAARSQAAKRTTDIAMRSLSLRQQYSSWWAERSSDPSFERNGVPLAQEAGEVLNKLSEQTLGGVDDPQTQAALSAEIYEYSSTQLLEAQRTQTTHQIAWSKAALENQLWQRRQELASVQLPERPRLMQQSLAMIHGAASAGFITPIEAEKKARAFVDGVAEDDLNYRVYSEPDQVLEDIYGGRYADMSVETRQRIILNAEKRSEAMRNEEISKREREDNNNRKVTREVQDLNFGTYYAEVIQGNITPPALYEALRENEIRGDQFKTLADAAEAISRKGGPGDPELAATMEQKAYRGQLAVGDILNALDASSGINSDERDKLLSILEKGAAATTTRDYKEGARTIDKALGVIPGNLAMGIRGRSDLVAGLALREYYQRAVSNPNFDAASVATEIINRYDIQDGKTPPPRYPTREEAREAYRRGDISDREFDNEISLHSAQQFKGSGSKPAASSTFKARE